ncbi:hypothetical protein V6Z11_D10G167500 [Gossypium hirsutum]|uniref:Uncharacterized protein isoform X2 n=1 Tax=Gossypium hirsutum TaxID=3635 RepID=A0ABM3AUJ4_GOSHI|nr:uncharacterized protein LOC121222226 isoform X2 [Gossypium hirsutum]
MTCRYHDIHVLIFFFFLPVTASFVQDLYLILMQHATTWVIQVKKLQQQLQEETDLHLALASAVEHCSSPSSSSPGKLPDKQALH